MKKFKTILLYRRQQKTEYYFEYFCMLYVLYVLAWFAIGRL